MLIRQPNKNSSELPESPPAVTLHRVKVALPAAVVILLLASGHGTKFEGSYGEGADFGPWRVPLSRQYHLSGPNISAQYPGSDPIYGWSWTVSVVADIPLSEANSTRADPYPKQTFTGSRVVLQAPTGPTSAVHDSWFVCVIHWDMDLFDYPAKLRADDGSCSTVLSEQCIRDIEARAVEEYRAASPNPSRCPSLAEIASCEGEQANTLTLGGSFGARWVDATAIRNWPDGKFNVRRFGGPSHEGGNLTAYDETGSLAWPVLAMWVPSANTRNSTGFRSLGHRSRIVLCQGQGCYSGERNARKWHRQC
ncbi:hypothetical protein N657DRAFT_675751 [Parathielavia appendiculata]|uniref:Uncharacterized protein n=1 Tax=Parathielavia appendiculata TaxID=2587402 RepID=A0AAN6TP96_9PEZI|nr:hypothetical protein N657DRAFT_675751 [Parathielavia appendiculata]